jgi:hypothetical protein
MFRTIKFLNKSYELRNYVDLVTGLELIGVSNSLGVYIGAIHGEEFPDENDIESVSKFNAMVTTWILDNEN